MPIITALHILMMTGLARPGRAKPAPDSLAMRGRESRPLEPPPSFPQSRSTATGISLSSNQARFTAIQMHQTWLDPLRSDGPATISLTLLWPRLPTGSILRAFALHCLVAMARCSGSLQWLVTVARCSGSLQ
jgi:hypothetical protein